MAVIKISELSIGDWVRYIRKRKKNDDYFQVAHIFRGEKEWLVGRKNDDIFGSHSLRLKDIEPIPLTPEILEKNGLEYEDDGNDAVIFLCCDMFWARLCVGDTFWQVGIHNEDRLDAVVCNVKHIHQLQHALRLAGVGKEIEV